MKKFFGHLKTVLRHKREVWRLCRKAGIGFQGLTHDLSKFSPAEFMSGVKYYTNGEKSPNERERSEVGYSSAWLHHKGRNRHHFEYWNDYVPAERRVEPIKMPLRFVAELLCDRVAASKIYQKEKYTDSHPLEYFLGGKANRVIHKQTSDFIEKMLTELKESGENVMFSHLRELVAKDKKTNCGY